MWTMWARPRLIQSVGSICKAYSEKEHEAVSSIRRAIHQLSSATPSTFQALRQDLQNEVGVMLDLTGLLAGWLGGLAGWLAERS